MKKTIVSIGLLLFVSNSFAQNIGIGTNTPQSKLSVGSSSQFQLDSVGNIKKINNVPYSFPSTQGSNGQVLTNNGSGSLLWQSLSSGVPYTGATGAVNLGAYDLTVNGLTLGMGGGSVSSNTVIGGQALNVNTTGHSNTSTGKYNLGQNTTGSINTATGYIALYSNTTGSYNTAIGGQALSSNVSGNQNTAIGGGANVASGALNNATALGSAAIVEASNTIQLGNTAVSNVKTSGTITAGAVTYPNAHGTSGQVLSTTGSGAISWTTPANSGVPYTGATAAVNFGAYDLTVNGLIVGRGVGGGDNIVIGNAALISNTYGAKNVAIGNEALNSNTRGAFNTATGFDALYHNLWGNNNTANGYEALLSNTYGANNTATGFAALAYNENGQENSSFGAYSLAGNTSGSYNTALGYSALNNNTSGDKNIAIGSWADVATPTLTNAVAIGFEAIVAASNTIQLGNTSVTNVKTSGTVTAGTVTYPNTTGTNGYYLRTDGAGTASWAAVNSGIPYTGATIDVDLGQHAFRVGGFLTASAGIFTGYINGIHIGNGNLVGGGLSTSIGNQALYNNTTGDNNTASGMGALYSNTTGNFNTANGVNALSSNTAGSNNTAYGYNALYSNIGSNYQGFSNTAIGCQALNSNTTGFQNTANGYQALYSNTIGQSNTATGYQALYSNAGNYPGGNYNTAHGMQALYFNTTGLWNTANGMYALYYNTTGIDNTANGFKALYNTTTGGDNVAFGNYALSSVTTGNSNTGIGFYADVTSTISNSTAIGYSAGCSASNQVRIGNSSVTSIGGYVGWSNLSDGRMKENIKEEVPGLSFINSLRPVTYTLNTKKFDNFIMQQMPDSVKAKRMQTEEAYITSSSILHTGFIAQEVEEAAKKVGFNFDGVDAPKNENDLYGLRYAEFVVPLVKSVQELSAENDSLKTKMSQQEKELQLLKTQMEELKKFVHKEN